MVILTATYTYVSLAMAHLLDGEDDIPNVDEHRTEALLRDIVHPHHEISFYRRPPSLQLRPEEEGIARVIFPVPAPTQSSHEQHQDKGQNMIPGEKIGKTRKRERERNRLALHD